MASKYGLLNCVTPVFINLSIFSEQVHISMFNPFGSGSGQEQSHEMPTFASFDSKKLKSPFYYKQALAMIKNKFFFSTDVYSVNYKEAILSLRMIMQTIDTDMVYIYSDQSGM